MSNPPLRLRALLVLAAAILLPGCRATLGTAEREAKSVLQNFRHVAGNIFSGGEPSEETAFKALRRLGIRTIVSVDGARPDADVARRHGMRYIHIPIGYEGINEHARLSLASLMHERVGPIYFHCHHGKHRAPAAAALACRAGGLMDCKAATTYMHRAGASEDYAGLWRDVREFTAPVKDTPLTQLVETAEVENLTAAMAEIDRAWDRLILCRDSNWKPPTQHPDITPAQETLLLEEGFRESARHLRSASPVALEEELQTAERIARQLRAALLRHDVATAENNFSRLRKSCRSCHTRHRNQAE